MTVRKDFDLSKSMILIFISFLNKISFNMLFPYLVIYVNNIVADENLVIVTLGVTFFQYCGTISSGYVSNFISKKRTLMIVLLIRISVCLLCLFNSNNSLLIIATFGIFSLLQGISLPLYDSLLIEYDNSNSKGNLLTINYWISNLALMIGILIGGQLVSKKIYLTLGSIFVGSCIELIIIYRYFTVFYVERKIEKNSFGIRDLFKSYLVVIVDKTFLIYSLGQILYLLLDYSRVYYVTLKLSNLNYRVFLFEAEISGGQMISYLTSFNVILVMLLMPLILRITYKKKKNRRNLFVMASFCYSLGYALLADSSILFFLIISTIIFSTAEAFLAPSKQKIFASIVSKKEKISCYVAINNLQFLIAKTLAVLSL
ncbi:MFS transporter [Enterococcus sp.]|uniref:MFS transporter n=1 Tax=Enterococcus sp. TaxID=35783 RepID=UPI002897964D|nr:MFS transporter [Enterococcus sp.]